MENSAAININVHCYFLDYIKIIATFFVIVIHVTGGSLVFYVAVPLFFIASGYLFAMHELNAQLRLKILLIKKFNRLLLPYFTATFIYIALKSVMGEYQISFLIEDVFLAGVGGHLYFLISLFFIYMICYGIRKILFRKNKTLFLFAIYIFINPIILNYYLKINLEIPKPDIFEGAINGLPYFLLGIILYYFKFCISNIIAGKELLLLLALGFIIIIQLILFDSGENIKLALIAVFFVLLALKIGEKPIDKIEKFSSLTFGIYLYHQPYFVKLFKDIFEQMSLNDEVLSYLTIVFSFVGTALMTFILKKYYFFSRFMFGETTKTYY